MPKTRARDVTATTSMTTSFGCVRLRLFVCIPLLLHKHTRTSWLVTLALLSSHKHVTTHTYKHTHTTQVEPSMGRGGPRGGPPPRGGRGDYGGGGGRDGGRGLGPSPYGPSRRTDFRSVSIK